MNLFRLPLLFGAALVAACTAAPGVDRTVNFPSAAEMPAMRVFQPRAGVTPTRSNAELARDFLELTFALESGHPLIRLTRFEGPITVRLTGMPLSPLSQSDFDRLLQRIRSEAKISISRVPADQAASITIEAIPARQLRRAVPEAACFVVPNVSSWEEFRRARRSDRLDWDKLQTRTKIAIFLPGDEAPQEIRDCLHEELAQAIGPLNDVFRLTDSVFNDDNFVSVLTGFDMLMLRATYSPRLRSGMSRAEVARALPGIFAAINPRGGGGGIAAPIATPRGWINAIHSAEGAIGGSRDRVRGAEKALAFAKSQNWTDSRLAYSHYIFARNTVEQSSNMAAASYVKASAMYNSSRNTRIQAARVDEFLARVALNAGDAEAAINIVNRHIRTVTESENAALLAILLFIKAEALTLQGQIDDAEVVRNDARGWALYGFGSIQRVMQMEANIARLRPLS